MNPREVKDWGCSEWERARERGKRHFILHYGLIGFAVPLALLMLVYFYVAQPMLFEGAGLGDMLPVRWGELLELVLVSAVVWPLAGWGWAEWVWRSAERKYPPEQA